MYSDYQCDYARLQCSNRFDLSRIVAGSHVIYCETIILTDRSNFRQMPLRKIVKMTAKSTTNRQQSKSVNTYIHDKHTHIQLFLLVNLSIILYNKFKQFNVYWCWSKYTNDTLLYKCITCFLKIKFIVFNVLVNNLFRFKCK